MPACLANTHVLDSISSSKRIAFCGPWTIPTSPSSVTPPDGLLHKREGYELYREKVLEHMKAVGCFCGDNSTPDRLHLSDEHAKMAKDLRITIAVNTDAHSISELDFIAARLNQPAVRGWNRGMF